MIEIKPGPIGTPTNNPTLKSGILYGTAMSASVPGPLGCRITDFVYPPPIMSYSGSFGSGYSPNYQYIKYLQACKGVRVLKILVSGSKINPEEKIKRLIMRRRIIDGIITANIQEKGSLNDILGVKKKEEKGEPSRPPSPTPVERLPPKNTKGPNKTSEIDPVGHLEEKVYQCVLNCIYGTNYDIYISSKETLKKSINCQLAKVNWEVSLGHTLLDFIPDPAKCLKLYNKFQSNILEDKDCNGRTVR